MRLLPSSDSIRLLMVGFITTSVVVYGLAAPFLISPVVAWALQGNLLWSALANVAAAIICVWYLYSTRGGKARHSRFGFGIALVVMAAVLYGNLGAISDHAQNAEKLIPRQDLDSFLTWKIFVSYAKDVVAFGIGAIGASLVSAAILEREADDG